MAEILFLGGPSGSGKSMFASQHLARRGWLHVETDQMPLKGGAENDLARHWSCFWERTFGLGLHEELQRRAQDKPGIVLTFPSNIVFGAEHLAEARGKFLIRYLFGSPLYCMQAFLARELQTDRGLGPSHWEWNNMSSYMRLAEPRNHPLLVSAFEGSGQRRPPELIYESMGLGRKGGGEVRQGAYSASGLISM